MKSFIKLCLTLFVAAAAGHAVPASAQATRTWVSGVGDDTNTCSRTAPCKTFAGTIAKTTPGGEINCLDPAGYGSVTITVAISIICPYTEGGVLTSGGFTAITVSAGASDAVYLSGLDLSGAGTGLIGVNFITGGSLTIENSIIRGFGATNGTGVLFQPSGTSRLNISNTTISNNGSAGTGGGITIQPTGASGGARFQINNVRLQGNANNGFRIDTTSNPSAVGVKGTIENSQISQSDTGMTLVTPAGGADARLAANNVTVSDNTTGLLVNGNFAKMLVSNSAIVINGIGVSALAGGSIYTLGNNRLQENTTNGAFTVPVVPSN
jgi:hypothetical protein